MMLFKCDKCGKVVPDKDKKTAVNVGFGIGFLHNRQLCAKCGKPIARILKRYKLKP